MYPSIAISQPSDPQSELQREIIKTRILEERAKQERLNLELRTLNSHQDMITTTNDYYKETYDNDIRYNNINNINQTANTAYNIAAQIKNISELLK
jgi:hypothetical protein